MKCTARIVKDYKTKKADCVWPKCCPSGNVWAENKAAADLEICGGEVKIVAELAWEPYFGGSDPLIEITETCSRCKHPFYDLYPFVHSVITRSWVDVTALLEQPVES